MDGNGWWVKQYGKLWVFGYKNGVIVVWEVIEVVVELGVEYVIFYVFFIENWKCLKLEVGVLMCLFVEMLFNEIEIFNKNNICFKVIGDFFKLLDIIYKALFDGIVKIQYNKWMILVLVFNYSGWWEIMEVVKSLSEQIKSGELVLEDINQDILGCYFSMKGMFDLELFICISGEIWISNFLFWQIVYVEFYFIFIYWLEFCKVYFYQVIIDYQW